MSRRYGWGTFAVEVALIAFVLLVIIVASGLSIRPGNLFDPSPHRFTRQAFAIIRQQGTADLHDDAFCIA